jgi:hypothetical protein
MATQQTLVAHISSGSFSKIQQLNLPRQQAVLGTFLPTLV